MYWLTTFLFLTILIALNALYVAAEFSTVSSRRSRLSHLANQGNKSAGIIFAIITDPKKLDAYIATCQVGITLSSLILGYLGQSQLSGLISPLLNKFGDISLSLANSISATFILIVLSILQILIGELVPKNVGIQFPERLATLTYKPLQFSSIIFKPLIWLFNGSGNLILRIFHLEPSSEHSHIHSPEEIGLLIDESGSGGALKHEEHRLLKNTLLMREAKVQQVMIPRARMLTAPIYFSPNQLLSLIADSPYSRIPLFKDTIDNILGVIHLRDLLCLEHTKTKKDIKEIMHSVPFIPESMLVKNVFSLLQKKHFQVAIVLDEFGGTAGMVTLEDLLEQIFGDLIDEFDTENPSYQILPGNQIWIRGDLLVEKVNAILNIHLPIENINTIGGLVLNAIGYVPIVNDEIEINGHKFRVEKMSGRGVATVSYTFDQNLFDPIADESND